MRFEKVVMSAFKQDLYRYGFLGLGFIEESYRNIVLPDRKTRFSAGYDFCTPIDFILKPGEKITIPTGIKCVFDEDEAAEWHLNLYIRSSVGIIRDVILCNNTGIIDPDYAGNPDNDGDILIALRNVGDHVQQFRAGDRIMQGVLERHGITANDKAEGFRKGGVGSTDERRKS